MFTELSLPKLSVSRRTALVVEDDPRLQKAMSEQLQRMGFQVFCAGHYEAAIRHLVTHEPHLACINVRLPNESGYDLCEHIRRSLGLTSLPIVMTSEYGCASDMAQAEDAGGDVFLLRPFSMRQLAACVDALLDSNRGREWPSHDLLGRVWKPTLPRTSPFSTATQLA
jgi:two-component system, OmpR family, response regulator